MATATQQKHIDPAHAALLIRQRLVEGGDFKSVTEPQLIMGDREAGMYFITVTDHCGCELDIEIARPE